MGNQNSLDRHYVGLFIACLIDVASASDAYKHTELLRDVRETLHRTAHEGLSFLTKTLPRLGKAIDFALSNGAPLRSSGLRLRPKTQIPQFLGCLLGEVFTMSGDERSDASIDALRALRLICNFEYKLELETTEDQAAEVIQQFISTDESLPSHSHDYAELSQDRKDQLAIAKRLIYQVVNMVDPFEDLRPKHGPGAVADGQKPHQKWDFSRRYYRKLHEVFPFWDYFVYNASDIADNLQRYLSYKEVESGTAKVILVPKDSRGPRLISCEPVSYQWIQQGLRRNLEKAITHSSLSEGQVNFNDQSINRRYALLGSQNQKWATLDMKEASDRVSVALVRQLFPERWLRCLLASRTDATRLPSGQIQPLNKFAPMGSSLCFPVESLVFWALSVAAVKQNRPHLSDWEASKSVFVFGDDLIVMSEDQGHVRNTLPSFNLLFNDAKCCVSGFFRESCGCDAYKGVDVTPLRLKKTWSHRSGRSIVSYVEFHNSALKRGLINVAEYVRNLLRPHISIPFSNAGDKGYLCYVDELKTALQVKHANRKIKRRWNSQLHQWEYSTWKVSTRSYQADTPGWSEMMRIASLNSGSRDSLRLAPVRVEHTWPTAKDVPDALIVEAYQYALPRQATLRRGWCRV